MKSEAIFFRAASSYPASAATVIWPERGVVVEVDVVEVDVDVVEEVVEDVDEDVVEVTVEE
jgi:hypothetical protein